MTRRIIAAMMKGLVDTVSEEVLWEAGAKIRNLQVVSLCILLMNYENLPEHNKKCR